MIWCWKSVIERVIETVKIASETDYEHLQALWADLESGLGVILAHPEKTSHFVQRVQQYAVWMEGLLAQDTDAGLYILFQLAGNSSVGYSTGHALICAVLAHLTADQLGMKISERTALIYAAFTMNVSMTTLQDTLTEQAENPTLEQSKIIAIHASRSAEMLRLMGVEDPVWLHLVEKHHQEFPNDLLLSILNSVDRYAAMISPRSYRPGRSAVESIRAIRNTIGFVLVRAVGVYPPGTYVQLTSQELAVVIRRTGPNTHPDVAIISTPEGEALAQPRLHLSRHSPLIQSALPASMVRARIRHFQILQLFPAS
jgi:HD-GYP domain-containing protein (c-di-GMP phosphodiesterase class II)